MDDVADLEPAALCALSPRQQVMAMYAVYHHWVDLPPDPYAPLVAYYQEALTLLANLHQALKTGDIPPDDPLSGASLTDFEAACRVLPPPSHPLFLAVLQGAGPLHPDPTNDLNLSAALLPWLYPTPLPNRELSDRLRRLWTASFDAALYDRRRTWTADQVGLGATLSLACDASEMYHYPLGLDWQQFAACEPRLRQTVLPALKAPAGLESLVPRLPELCRAAAAGDPDARAELVTRLQNHMDLRDRLYEGLRATLTQAELKAIEEPPATAPGILQQGAFRVAREHWQAQRPRPSQRIELELWRFGEILLMILAMLALICTWSLLNGPDPGLQRALGIAVVGMLVIAPFPIAGRLRLRRRRRDAPAVARLALLAAWDRLAQYGFAPPADARRAVLEALVAPPASAAS